MRRILFWFALIWCVSFPISAGQEPEITSLEISLSQQGEIRDIDWSPDGSLIALASSLGIWIYQANDPDLTPFLLNDNDKPASMVTFSPNGNFLAAVYDGVVGLWDLKLSTLIASYTKSDPGFIEVLAFNPEGTQLLIGTTLGDLHIWDLDDTSATITHLEGEVKAVSNNWSMIATIENGNLQKISIWVLDQQTHLYNKKMDLTGHGHIVDIIQFNHPMTLLASSSGRANEIFIWSLETGEFLGIIDEFTRILAFNPQGNLLATASPAPGFIIFIWDISELPDRRFLRVEDHYLGLNGHSSDLIDLTFSHDGTHIASISDDQTMRIWDLAPVLEYRTESSQ